MILQVGSGISGLFVGIGQDQDSLLQMVVIAFADRQFVAGQVGGAAVESGEVGE